MEQVTGNDHGLSHAAGCAYSQQLSQLRLVRTGAQADDVIALPTALRCDGSYTCNCMDCQRERQRLVDRAAHKAA
jgi:hypothetical protein